MYVYSNPNPFGAHVGDCVVRAISIITNEPWEKVYIELAVKGLLMGDMPSSNAVWSEYLLDRGFKQKTLSRFITVTEFCRENPNNDYLLATGSHLVAAISGDYLDAWNSGDEIITYYFYKNCEE